MSEAKALILARLHEAGPANQPANTPAVGASQRRANPTLLSEDSEYVAPFARPDAPVIAGAAGDYYHEGGAGNRASEAQLAPQRTLQRVGPNTRTSPAGQGEPGGSPF